ncbi:hypothetical protein M3Y99_00141300 [Aphelenchoides fujianensis]|nr:hypothetical protein M3Y99_00141300 [Aphelenchoides fujianensis]
MDDDYADASPGSTNGGLPTPVKRTLGNGLGRARGQFKRPNGPFALPNLYPREEANGAAGGGDERPMEVDEREERRADDDRSQEEGKSPNKSNESPAKRSPFSSQNRHSQSRVQNFVTTAGVAEVPPMGDLGEQPADANGGERREERVQPRPRLPSPPPSQHNFDRSLEDRLVLGSYRPHASTPAAHFGRPPLVHCTSTVTIPPADGVIQQNGRPPVNPGATAHIKVNGVAGPRPVLAPKIPNPTVGQVAELAAELKANGFSMLTQQELMSTAKQMLETGRRPSGFTAPVRPPVVRETLPVTSPPPPPNGPQFANSAQQAPQQQRKPAVKRTAAEMNGDVDGDHLPADLRAEFGELRALIKAEHESNKKFKAEMMNALLQQGNQFRREIRDGFQMMEKKFMAEVQDLRISFNESRTTESAAQRSSSSGWGYGQQQRRAGSAGRQPPGDTVDIERLMQVYHEQPLDGGLLDDAQLMPPPGDFRNSRSSGYGGENSWITDQHTTAQAPSPEIFAGLFGGAFDAHEAQNAQADGDVTKSGKPKKLARPKTDKKPGPTPLEKFGAPAYNLIDRARVDNLMASEPRATSTFAVLCKWMYSTADRQKPMDARDAAVTAELRQVMEERFPASGVPYANTRWKKWVKEENTRAVRLAECYEQFNASQAPLPSM